MEELAQRLQQLETQVGQQRAVTEDQQEQLMRQQTTIDAERAGRTPVNPAQDARVNLVISELETTRRRLRVKHTSGKVGHSKCDSTSRRIGTLLGTRECGCESVARDALAGMNEPQKRLAKQLAVMLTIHTKDRALQMITKLSDPANGLEIWRRFLEEREPAHRGRY